MFIHFIQPFNATAVGGVTPGAARRKGKWLDKMDETFWKQLQDVSKTFHPLYLAIYLPIHHYGGGLRPPFPQQWELPSEAPRCCGFHNGGWRDKWLDKVDETFLKHVAIVSNTLHQLYPTIYYCLDI